MTGMAMCQKEPADGVTHLPVIQGGRETQNAIVLISVRYASILRRPRRGKYHVSLPSVTFVTLNYTHFGS
jgi:hypothetical protein